MREFTDGYRARWAILIGIDRYPPESGLPTLSYAVNDAEALADLLIEDFGYPVENVQIFRDEEATGEAIRKALAHPAGGALDLRDTLLVFFAGHGLIDAEDRGSIAPFDSRIGDSSGRIEVAELREALAATPPLHKLLVLDSCYSGTLFQREEVDRKAAPETSPPSLETSTTSRGPDPLSSLGGLEYYLSEPAFFGISAGRITPVADGLGEDRHSVFTSHLLDVLRERADSRNAEHAFTFRQLAGQVEARVASTLGSRQVPDWGRLGPGNGDLVFRPVRRRLTPHERAVETEHLLEQELRSSETALRQAFGLASRKEQRELVAEWRGQLDRYLHYARIADIAAEKVYQQVLAWKGVLIARDRRPVREARNIHGQGSGRRAALFEKGLGGLDRQPIGLVGPPSVCGGRWSAVAVAGLPAASAGTSPCLRMAAWCAGS